MGIWKDNSEKKKSRIGSDSTVTITGEIYINSEGNGGEYGVTTVIKERVGLAVTQR